jgi:glycosyltransferase involved in cell wall biosynthesis
MKIIFFANTDWYLYNFRLPLARAVRNQGGEVVFVSPYGVYGDRLLAEGFRWVAVPMYRRSFNPLRELKLIMMLTDLFKRERVTLTHHFTIKCVVYGTIAAELAGVRGCVNAITGMGYVFANDGAIAKLLKPLVKIALKIVLGANRSRLVLQNQDDVDLFISQRIATKERVRLIRSSGVNTQKFNPLRKRALTIEKSINSCCKVLLATRLLWDKGISEYVASSRIIKDSTSIQVDFLLAGRPDIGNPSSVPIQKIAEWDKTGLIKYLGHVERIDNLLSEVDIVVLPSYREGLPRILLEAAASGLPIVATDVPGCREIVQHNLNGLLISPRNPMALAEAILYLSENPDERIRMGKVGRMKAVSEFDERLVIHKTLNVYDELLAK